MATSIAQPAQSDPVRTLDEIRPTPVKACLSSDRVGPSVPAVVKDAVVRHYGSVKAAAISLGVDPSLMMREFDAGKLGRLEADAEARASVVDALHAAFGRSDPKGYAIRALSDIRERLAVIDRFLHEVQR